MKLRIARKLAAQKGKTLHDVRHRVVTFARAIARLRKNWRHCKRIDKTEDSRLTGEDFFRSNRLASIYHRLQWLHHGDFGHRPYANESNHGKARSLQ